MSMVPGLSTSDLSTLLSEIKDFLLSHGSVIKMVAYEEETMVPARPVATSALPTPFPRKLFKEAMQIQQSMCELYIRAAADEQWLKSVIEPLIEHDELLAALWKIHCDVKNETKNTQRIVCGWFRSDYMVHRDASGPSLEQVEMNTLSVAGACHAEIAGKMHRHLQSHGILGQPRDLFTLPFNNNTQFLINCLAETHGRYVPRTKHRVCILMVVEPFNFNIADERPIEYGLWDTASPCHRCDWPLILSRTTLLEDQTLLYHPTSSTTFEVSLVYYRALYVASDYALPSTGHQTRHRLEVSRAMKCPDILTHLAGFKTVQQALTTPNTIERFLPEDPSTTSRIRQSFMPILPLDTSPLGLSARDIATDPSKAQHYVLKPNLEGGGHNIYRADIPDFLASIPQYEWCKYILMRVIDAPDDTMGTLMTGQGLYHGPVVSELGVLGACIWRKKGDGTVEILMNEVGGWTFKTKPRHVDEMSVVKGYGCFDCPRLVD